jgi:hypothetical protein
MFTLIEPWYTFFFFFFFFFLGRNNKEILYWIISYLIPSFPDVQLHLARFQPDMGCQSHNYAV